MVDNSRRAFFRRAAGKAAEKVVEHAQGKIEARATRWLRPPFAVPELEFILACTRCGDCFDACPYQVLFPLAASYGADVAATAALDVMNGGCHLCKGWPCVAACEAGALQWPTKQHDAKAKSDKEQWPKMAIAEISTEKCLPYKGPECGACAGFCPIPGALSFHLDRPRIDPDRCSGCGLCHGACIAMPKAIDIRSLYAQ